MKNILKVKKRVVILKTNIKGKLNDLID